jgi:transposase
MEKAKRRSFTEDYKRQTVELVRSSGRSIGSVAAEIGLAETVLRKWVNKFGVPGQPAAATRRSMTQAALPTAVGGSLNY